MEDLRWIPVRDCVFGTVEAHDAAGNTYRKAGSVVSCYLADGRRGTGDTPEAARDAAQQKPRRVEAPA